MNNVPILTTKSPLSIVGGLSAFVFSLVQTVNLVLLKFNIIRMNLDLGDRSPDRETGKFLALTNNIVVAFTGRVLSLVIK